ncbi:MAG: type II toxin-antitoxin system prevent-host-death family antitoxin [Geodermatophilaceae bacterium]|nr:type II toxin-antitoxin system prevent-host-death family antitoxin [Geodermatophilaceae bacterium]MDQ3463792.1 type II toxin-antitoxin system prevent-host-death family antitoxin [Actinomycetota bacterium]
MIRVASRELRNATAGLLRRAGSGERVIITVNGEPVAELGPLSTDPARRRWITRSELAARLAWAQADPGLRADLARLHTDSTDDLGPIR